MLSPAVKTICSVFAPPFVNNAILYSSYILLTCKGKFIVGLVPSAVKVTEFALCEVAFISAAFHAALCAAVAAIPKSTK